MLYSNIISPKIIIILYFLATIEHTFSAGSDIDDEIIQKKCCSCFCFSYLFSNNLKKVIPQKMHFNSQNVEESKDESNDIIKKPNDVSPKSKEEKNIFRFTDNNAEIHFPFFNENAGKKQNDSPTLDITDATLDITEHTSTLYKPAEASINVLFVEDSVPTCKIVRKMFEACNKEKLFKCRIELTICTSMGEAISHYKANNKPHIVLTDIQMEETNSNRHAGLVLAEYLFNEKYSNAVIALTSNITNVSDEDLRFFKSVRGKIADKYDLVNLLETYLD